jgi:hypothetical protein
MAMTYSIVPADDALLHIFRLLAGSGMAASLALGYAAIRRGEVETHQGWMRRAYAIGQGAGTQATTQLPLVLLLGPLDDLPKALAMGAAWAINLGVAEWLIRRRRQKIQLVPAAA